MPAAASRPLTLKEGYSHDMLITAKKFKAMSLESALRDEIERCWKPRAIKAEARISQLEAALRKYGQHTRSPLLCSQANFYDDEHGPCTCGFSEIVVSIAQAPASETAGVGEPEIGIGSYCYLCGNAHDLLSACPPKKTKGEQT